MKSENEEPTHTFRTMQFEEKEKSLQLCASLKQCSITTKILAILFNHVLELPKHVLELPHTVLQLPNPSKLSVHTAKDLPLCNLKPCILMYVSYQHKKKDNSALQTHTTILSRITETK